MDEENSIVQESLQESREDLEAEVKLLRLQNQFLSAENDNLKSNSFRMVEILSKMDILLQKSYEKIQNLQAENHTLQEKQTANQISLLENRNSLLTDSSSLLSDPNALSLANQNALSLSNQNALSLIPNGNTLSLTNQNSLSLTTNQTPSLLVKNETLSDLIPIGNNGNNVTHNGNFELPKINGNGQEMGFLEIQSLKRLEKAKKEDEIKRDENGLFICPHCDTRMTFKHNMVAHIRVHTGERPFKCDFCPKRFSTPSSCKNHIKTHTGEKRFVCTVCDARFARSGQLRIHTKKWHDGVGYSKIESKTKTSSLEEIAETMVTSLQPSLLPTKEQIRSLGIDDNELLRTLREGLSQSETTNLTSNDTSKTPISSTNQNEEPEVEEITGSYIPNSFELFM